MIFNVTLGEGKVQKSISRYLTGTRSKKKKVKEVSFLENDSEKYS